MNANLASIMPQVLGVWCEEAGHEVTYVCYTGGDDLLTELPSDLDVLFIGAFTQAAQLAYAIEQPLSQPRHGHGARRPPRALLSRGCPEVLRLRARVHRSRRGAGGARTSARPTGPRAGSWPPTASPRSCPPLEARWKFVEAALAKAPTIKFVPMIGSLGCPYTCSFCIDSTVDYQPLGFDQVSADLAFLLTKMKRPDRRLARPQLRRAVRRLHGGHRARRCRASACGTSPRAACRCSPSRTSQRLRKNGFQAILPGIESWYDMGNKSKTRRTGMEKVQQVAEHVNLILRYIPYIQTNFVLGLDTDEGPEPFELTKRFLDLAPGAFPAYSLLSAFGRAAPLNLEYQRDGRVVPFPFTFLNNNHAMNVRPKNYDWPAFYDHLVDLSRYSFSWRAIRRRFGATDGMIPRGMNVVRAMSSEGWGRIEYHTGIRRLLDEDPSVRPFMEGESAELPQFYARRIERDLGDLYPHLPAGAMMHDPNAYLKSAMEETVTIARPAPGRRAVRPADPALESAVTPTLGSY